jgi:hypothetical protein
MLSKSPARADAAGRLASRHMAWQRGERPSWPCWVSPGGDRGVRASAPGSRRRGSLTRSGLDPVDPQRARTPGEDPALDASLCRGEPINLPRHDSPYIRPYSRRTWTHQRASYWTSIASSNGELARWNRGFLDIRGDQETRDSGLNVSVPKQLEKGHFHECKSRCLSWQFRDCHPSSGCSPITPSRVARTAGRMGDRSSNRPGRYEP